MYTMGSTDARMPRKKPEGPIRHFQFRMTSEETARWVELFTKARKKTHNCIDQSEFNRLLLGLKNNPAVLTEQDRIYFQQAGLDKAELIGRGTPTAKPHIREVSPRSKRGTT